MEVYELQTRAKINIFTIGVNDVSNLKARIALFCFLLRGCLLVLWWIVAVLNFHAPSVTSFKSYIIKKCSAGLKYFLL